MQPEISIQGVVVRELSTHNDERGSLTELFRADELDKEFYPLMSYISMTRAGVTRGPHEHVDQADIFLFLGPSTFRVYLWAGSFCYGCVAGLVVPSS